MKVFQIYNEQRSRFGGEPTVINATMDVLARNGDQSRLVMKSSRALENSALKRAGAFFGGIYNVPSYYEMRRLLKEDRPDVVHVHSVYPMFSPSILVACRKENVPVVMTVHNQNFTCPTAFHLYEGKICEDCIGGHEYHCVIKNCRNNLLESSAYALRSSVARQLRLFHDNVDVFIALTPFGKSKLMQAGFRDDQIAVVPNPMSIKDTTFTPPAGNYVAFAGRVSSEKGVDTLLAAAAQIPDVLFKIAGDGPVLQNMKAAATKNVEFLGQLGGDQLREFYRGSRFVVIPSVCYDQFPMVALESMAAGLPLIASRIGGLPFVVDEGLTGLLFEPGNASDLLQQIERLWNDPNASLSMGKAGQQKVTHQFSQDAYYLNLVAVYKKAIQHSRNRALDVPLVQISNATLRSREQLDGQ